MNLKDYYLLKERAYFIDLATLSEEIINQLQEKLAKKKSIRSGDKITVKIADAYELDIKLYKGKSHAARNALSNKPVLDGESDGSSAMYFPATADSNGRIEIYVNSSKKDQDYYKERKFEDFINKSLPKYIKDILRHEIAHAYEDIVSGAAHYKPTTNKTATEYYNSDEEVNAYFMEWFPGEIQNNKVAQHHLLAARNAKEESVKTDHLNRAAKVLLQKLSQMPWVAELDEKNKKWLIKTTYTSVRELLDRAK